MHIRIVKCCRVYSSQYDGTFSLTLDIEATASVSHWKGGTPINIIDVRMYCSFSKRLECLLWGNQIYSRTASLPFGLRKGPYQRQCVLHHHSAHAHPLASCWVWCPCTTDKIRSGTLKTQSLLCMPLACWKILEKSSFSWASVSSSIKQYH